MRAPEIAFPALLQDFFLQRLIAQRAASAQTIASYRDAFELLLRFAERSTKRPASALKLPDLYAPLVLDFLDHLERERGNSPRTRNARLAALHSFMRYASLRDPSALAVAQRVLAIPTKRFDRPVLGYLSREEMEALLAAHDSCTWSGRRDAVLFAVLYNSGARVSEITGVCVADVLLDREVAVRLHGNPCHAYCISFRRRDKTTGKPACRQACDLASSAADVGWVVRRGIGIGPCTGEHGAGRAGPMSEPFPG